jgi:hypothetical protein
VHIIYCIAYEIGGSSSVQPCDLAGVQVVNISFELCAVVDV